MKSKVLAIAVGQRNNSCKDEKYNTVSRDILVKICIAFDCKLDDIVEIIPYA